jgi:hypothetical protein
MNTRGIWAGSLVPLAGLALIASACSSPAPGPTHTQPTTQADTNSGVDAVGGNCTEVTTGVSLCQTNSLCPGLQMDATAFPNCGFEIHGAYIDPECLCAGQICSVGTPNTCAEAQQLFSAVSVDEVCAKAAAMHCYDPALGSISCQVCKDDCNGNAQCIHNCGC